MTERIKLAIQKKGRLTDSCRKIFEQSGLSLNEGERQLVYSIPEMPIDILFVRDDDIPMLVSKGTCDFGIVGLNVFQEVKLSENNFKAEIFEKLCISKCRLSIAVPSSIKLDNLEALNGLKIATTYPAIVGNFLKENNLTSEVVRLFGSVEIAPSLGLSDVIADIVSSGATLKQNSLSEVKTILNSEAVLINNKDIGEEKRKIANQFVARLKTALKLNTLDFEKGNGLIPAIVQDDRTMEVLMLGYMNKEALAKTLQTKQVTFFSRSKNRLWTKGETSGNFLKLVGIEQDCDNDTLLARAIPMGPTCHLGTKSCFGTFADAPLEWLPLLEEVIENRKKENNPEASYTARLFQRGLSRMAQKVGEEGLETALAAVTDDPNFIGEAADLIFHLLVLLNAKGFRLRDVSKYLKTRNK